ncbi:MAG: penicillin-binding protein 2 [Caldisericia bacterium]|nr:penicillin-binding protein 2 [Caldisericia bacterium]
MIQETVNNKKKELNNKILKLFIVIILCFVVIFLKLIYVNLIKSSEFKNIAEAQWFESGKIIKAKRGTIYDRNGNILAISILRYRLILNKNLVKDFDKTVEILFQKLKINKNDLIKKINDSSSQVVLLDDIKESEIGNYKDLIDDEIYFESYYKRVYPYENLASYLLGTMGVDKGLEGVEFQFDSLLKGEDGVMGFLKDATGKEIPGSEFIIKNPKDGKDIYLTIDINIQGVVERELEKTFKEYKPKRVIGIVESVKTGELISIATIPNFDPNSFDEFSKATYPDPSYGFNYEPGSSFKPLVASAALEEDLIKDEDKFYCKGYTVIDNKTFKCFSKHGEQTLKDLLKNSCNIGFIEVGKKLGKKLYYYLKLFGVGEKIGLDFPYEGKGDILEPDNWSATTLPTMSFGVGITVTPLQQTSFYQTIANGGNRLKPQIIKKILDNNKTVLESKPVLIKKVISKETADKVLSYLDYVVNGGGVKSAVISGYSIGGKTGTAGVIENGKYKEGFSVLWFVGIVSAKNPEYVITVVVDGIESQDVFAAGIAAPTFRKIAQFLINYYGIEKDEKTK